MDERYQAAFFAVLTITPCPQNIVDIFRLITITIQKHFPESKNPSQISKMFWILGRVLDSRKCFWILGYVFMRILGGVLDSGKYFWIQESALDSVVCFGFGDVFCP